MIYRVEPKTPAGDYSTESTSLYVRNALRYHLGDLIEMVRTPHGMWIPTANPLADISTAKLREVLAELKEQLSEISAEIKAQLAELREAVREHNDLWSRNFADAIAVMQPRVEQNPDTRSAGQFKDVFAQLCAARDRHEAEARRDAAPGGVSTGRTTVSLDVCVEHIGRELDKRGASKAAELAKLKAQLSELGVEVDV